jgi:hypothetical protein
MITKSNKRITKLSLLLMGISALFLFYFGQVICAEEAVEDEQKEETVKFEQITGVVALFNSRMINIEYSREAGVSREILIPLDEETSFRHLRGLNDIYIGDTVTVKYKESYIEEEDGRRVKFKRVATEIVLVRRATKSLRSAE